MTYGTILVVEDNKDHQSLICKVLEKSLTIHSAKPLYSLIAVDTCSGAIRFLSKKEVNLVILDLNLKDRANVQGGFEVLEKINNYSVKTAVIVFTGHGSVEVCKRALCNNANSFIEKPNFEPLTVAYIENKLIPEVLKLLSALDTTQWQEQKNILLQFTEDELIDKILIPLLVQMGFPGIERTSFHGPGELGKDIKPFYSIGHFGERNYYGAQIKAGDVDSTAGSKRSVNKLIEQIDKILITKFTDPVENIKRGIDKAMVILSGDFKGESLRIIQDKFEGKNNIILINGDRLLNLINRYRLTNLLLPSSHSSFEIDEQEYIETDKNIFIFAKIKGKPTKIEILEKISDFLCEKNIVSSKEKILNKLLQREIFGSTCFGRGVALPHAILKHPKTIFILCVTDEGINWDSIDKQDCNIICFLLANNIKTKIIIQSFLGRYFKHLISFKDIYKKEKYQEIFEEIGKLSKWK